jgi:uncharacterized protein (TIGR02452 family)
MRPILANRKLAISYRSVFTACSPLHGRSDMPTLVLGAWGCGAFENDPYRTASDFRQALENDFDGAFSEIVFAITDWSPERRFLGPFRDVFVAKDPA